MDGLVHSVFECLTPGLFLYRPKPDVQLGPKCRRAQPPNGTGAVPLAVSIVLAKLRLCRPLGLFSTCRLKAMIPDERAESPERPCQRRQVSVPPPATAPGSGGSCRWDPALNISFHRCKLIPAQKLGTSVFQLVASKVDGVQDRVGMVAERLGHPLRKVTVGRRVTHLSKVRPPPGDMATNPTALRGRATSSCPRGRAGSI